MSTVQHARRTTNGRASLFVPLGLVVAALGCGPTSVVKQFDGNVSEGDAGSDDGSVGGGGGEYVSKAKDSDCDMTGVWIARMTTFAKGAVDTVGANWYFLELAQEGEEVEVVDHYDCGFVVEAVGIRVITPPRTLEALAAHNLQKGRRGTMKKVGDRCDLKLARFWSVRGASEETYLPRGHHDTRDIADLQAEVPLPTKANPEGAEDWDEDGKPGITLLAGNNDERNTVQRDWVEWFSCNGVSSDHPACSAENADRFFIEATEAFDEFTVRVDFNNEDSVLAASSPLFEAAGHPNRQKNNRITFKLLGRTREDPMAKDFLAKSDLLARCNAIQTLYPVEKVSE